jgi:hypothetical protein
VNLPVSTPDGIHATRNLLLQTQIPADGCVRAAGDSLDVLSEAGARRRDFFRIAGLRQERNRQQVKCDYRSRRTI